VDGEEGNEDGEERVKRRRRRRKESRGGSVPSLLLFYSLTAGNKSVSVRYLALYVNGFNRLRGGHAEGLTRGDGCL